MPSAVTIESLFENKWTVSRPDAKILEWQGGGKGSLSPGQVLPKRWVEYDFDRVGHTIHQYDIGSTPPSAPGTSGVDSTYALSSLDNGSATSVHYTSLQCYPRAVWKTLSREKFETDQRWWLGWDLEIAREEAEITAQQRLKAPSPSATPIPCAAPTPIGPIATATPNQASSGTAR